MKIRDLRKLPKRNWDVSSEYSKILVIPSGRKHDSGWALMYIIGVGDDGEPKEIAAVCDDICWHIPNEMSYELRNDMYFKGSVLRYWSNGYKFKVGASLSSTDVYLVEK